MKSAIKNEDVFSIATLLYARLRRVNGRVIDVVYLRQNQAYAEHVMTLARDTKDAELLAYVERLETALNVDRGIITKHLDQIETSSKKMLEPKQVEHVSFSLF